MELRNPVDTIFIIGNGFDMWQGLRSSYSEFQKYYLEHREKILRKLHIKKHIFVDSDGENIECSDVELIYGDPFQPDELDNEFWNTFEASLDNLDAERLNLFFGKEKSGFKEMEKSIKNDVCHWTESVRHLDIRISKWNIMILPGRNSTRNYPAGLHRLYSMKWIICLEGLFKR